MCCCLHRMLSTTWEFAVPAGLRHWAGQEEPVPKLLCRALLLNQPATCPLQVLTDKKDFEALMQKPGKVVVDYMASW